MAGLRGNVGWIMAQRQTGGVGGYGVLATPAIPGAAPGAIKSALAGGGMANNRTIGQLAETDSSRDQGVSFVSQVSAGGSPEIYARDASLGFWLYMTLGADAITGTTPNYTHVITPSNALPYFSMWRDVGDVLWESYQDCKCSSLVVAATAGNPLTATATVMGRTPVRSASDPSTTPAIPLQSGYVYNYNDATVTLAGGATALVSSFSLTINNNISVQQTDDVTVYDVVEGQRQVELDFDLVFATLDEYNKFHYGSISGTAVTPTIYTTSSVFNFATGANNSIDFNLPSIAYSEFPVDVNPNGDPVTVAVKAIGQRSGSPIVTATVKNQIQTY